MAYIPYNFCSYQKISSLSEVESSQRIEDCYQMHKQQSKTEAHSQLFKTPESRSKKRIAQVNYEISFQDTIFETHIQNFENILSNYFDKVQKIEEYKKLAPLKRVQNFSDKFDCFQQIQDQINNLSNISQKERQQLISDWQREQNLVKFLSIILSNVQPQLRSSFIYLASLTWEKYLLFSNLEFEEEERMKKISASFTSQIQKLYVCQQLSNLTFSSQNSQKGKQDLLELVRDYSQIIYLVVEGYFYNPFDISLERKLSNLFSHLQANSDSEDFFMMGLPRKLPKLQ